MARRLIAALVLCLAASTALADPATWRGEWPNTDFSRTVVPDWAQIRSGGPGRDGIPAVDAPRFAKARDDGHLSAREPVLVLEMPGAVLRAWPIRYLMWHEIVNDTVGGVPVAVTFCPLCNSGLIFDRRVGGQTLDFGVTGKLRASDMVMYDRQSESWWQQATGTAIVGAMTGQTLTQLPGWMESWEEFATRNPGGEVMQPPGRGRDYGRNPYVGYDSAPRPFLYDGTPPPHGIAPLERVVRVGNRAWPMTRLRAAGGLREAGLVIDWRGGQASALDTARIAEGRDVGTIRVRDREGRDQPHDVMFAFAFHALYPNGRWMLPK